MTSTNVSICNEALSMIGAKTIQSFDDNNRKCTSLRFDLCQYTQGIIANASLVIRQETHSLHQWAHILRLATAMLSPLPKDFLRLYDSGQHEWFKNEGRRFQQHLTELIIHAMEDNEGLGALFEQGRFIWSKVAKPHSSNAEADSMAETANMLKQARAINGQERPAQDFAQIYTPNW